MAINNNEFSWSYDGDEIAPPEDRDTSYVKKLISKPINITLMSKHSSELEYTVAWGAYKEEEQWYPSIIIYLNDVFQRQAIYRIGFDKKRYALLYAEMTAQAEIDRIKRTADHINWKYK